jgi:hypothetical protein
VTEPEDLKTEECLGTMDELVELLRGEISHLEKGDLTLIDETLERKRDLLARVERITPLLQVELARNTGLSALVRARLKGVRDLLERNMTMIQGLTTATRSIKEELSRIETRHSLKGIYGSDGQPRDGQVRTRRQLDRSV